MDQGAQVFQPFGVNGKIPRTALLLLLAACGSRSVTPPDATKLSLGTWGGEDAGVIVEDSVAHVHIACTFGNFPAPVPLDGELRFTVDGSYVLRAYPVQTGPPLPAQFAGVVQGDRLTLTIAVNDTVEKKVVALGPVTVRYKQEANMRQCPICRREVSAERAARASGSDRTSR
jgi:hypothetical protein